MWTTTLLDHDMLPFQWGVVIGASLIGATFDLHSRRIPNRLTGPLYLAGLFWACWLGGSGGLADGFVGALVLALPYVLLFLFAGGGAGDAKMMGALGAWLGIVNATVVLVAVALVGGIMAVGITLVRKEGRKFLANMSAIAYSLVFLFMGHRKVGATQILMPSSSQMRTMPYGLSILLGVCVAASGLYLWHA